MKKRGVFLAVALVLGFGVLALGLAALQPVRAQTPDCTPLYAYIKEVPAINVLTGSLTISDVSLAWDGEWAVYTLDINVNGDGAALEIGSPLTNYDYFTYTYDTELEYAVYVLVDVDTVGGAVSDNSTVAGDVGVWGNGVYGPNMMVNGLYRQPGNPGSDPTLPGLFYVRLEDTVEAGKVQLVATWKVLMENDECPPLSTPTPTPTVTPGYQPTPTPRPNEVDIYNLPGDYGTVGRLFDFGIILGVAQGLINFIGIDNLRDWIALGAGLAVLFTVVAGARPTTPPQS